LKGEFIRGIQENYGDAPVEIKNTYTHEEVRISKEAISNENNNRKRMKKKRD
jgi:hypothetical protein